MQRFALGVVVAGLLTGLLLSLQSCILIPIPLPATFKVCMTHCNGNQLEVPKCIKIKGKAVSNSAGGVSFTAEHPLKGTVKTVPGGSGVYSLTDGSTTFSGAINSFDGGTQSGTWSGDFPGCASGNAKGTVEVL